MSRRCFDTHVNVLDTNVKTDTQNQRYRKRTHRNHNGTGNGTATLEPGACRSACAAADCGTDWPRRLSVCKAHGGYTSKAGTSCCTFETATSVLALAYSQAPKPCHSAPSRARRRDTCCVATGRRLQVAVAWRRRSIHRARRPARREFRLRVVLIAVLGPPVAFPAVPHGWSGLVFAGLRRSVGFWAERAHIRKVMQARRAAIPHAIVV